jgi:hypothetical protein
MQRRQCRLDLDLHIWRFGLGVTEPTDFGLYAGPFNIQIETNKGYATGFPPRVPTVRLLFPVPCNPGRLGVIAIHRRTMWTAYDW